MAMSSLVISNSEATVLAGPTEARTRAAAAAIGRGVAVSRSGSGSMRERGGTSHLAAVMS